MFAHRALPHKLTNSPPRTLTSSAADGLAKARAALDWMGASLVPDETSPCVNEGLVFEICDGGSACKEIRQPYRLLSKRLHAKCFSSATLTQWRNRGFHVDAQVL